MAHIESAKQKHQITNPHSKMRGHANDIHLQSKTKESRKGPGVQRKIEGPGVSGGTPKEFEIIRPYDHVKGKKNFKYLGHFNKPEYVNQGHNVTPMQLPPVTSMPLIGGGGVGNPIVSGGPRPIVPPTGIGPPPNFGGGPQPVPFGSGGRRRGGGGIVGGAGGPFRAL